MEEKWHELPDGTDKYYKRKLQREGTVISQFKQFIKLVAFLFFIYYVIQFLKLINP